MSRVSILSKDTIKYKVKLYFDFDLHLFNLIYLIFSLQIVSKNNQIYAVKIQRTSSSRTYPFVD